jgi:hypothetical protein
LLISDLLTTEVIAKNNRVANLNNGAGGKSLGADLYDINWVVVALALDLRLHLETP